MLIFNKTKKSYCKKCKYSHIKNGNNKQYCQVFLIKNIKKLYKNIISYDDDEHIYMSDKVGNICHNCCDNFTLKIEPYLFPLCDYFLDGNFVNGFSFSIYVVKNLRIQNFFHYIYHLECLLCKNKNTGLSYICKCPTCKKCNLCNDRECIHIEKKRDY